MKKYIVIISVDGDEIWRKQSERAYMPGDAVIFENREWIVVTQHLDAKTSYYAYQELKEELIELARQGKKFQFNGCAYSIYQNPFYSEEVCLISTKGIYNDPIRIVWRRNLN